MRTSQDGIELIKHFEGFRSYPYQCQAGVWTVGYGHTRGVTQDTPPVNSVLAEALLVQDLRNSERCVNNLTHVELNQQQFDALVSFVFNLGGGAFQRSKLRMKLN